MENKTLNKAKIIKIIIAVLAIGGIGGGIYWYSNRNIVYIEDAEISAPHIDLSADSGGSLKETFVKIGDVVDGDTAVARVGNELVKTGASGLIVNVKNDIGRNFNRGEAVASMIDPAELRVVGHLDENKGLVDIHVGQRAVFTVDAFGSKKFIGTIDEISPVSRESGVVFNISDKRETKQFDIKVRFNTDQYPELKDGMSAKIWIYKD